MFAASVIGLKASNLLYYYNISSDDETILVGLAGIQIGAIYIGILTLIAVLIRIINNIASAAALKKQAQKVEQETCDMQGCKDE